MASISKQYLVKDNDNAPETGSERSGTLFALVYGTNIDLNPLLSVRKNRFDRLYVVYAREREA